MKKEKNKTPIIKHESNDSLIEKDIKSNQRGFPVVGIGASAGGLEAFEQFFSSMPEDSGFAFVVIQHLSPDHKGILGELIQRYTNMRVYTVTNGMKVEPNSVYVIPANKSMIIHKGALNLFKPEEKHGLRLPIDLFFRSLARDQMEKSIGIILSGMGSDGSLGLKDIKERAGMVLVQDPASAKFDSMPLSAIEAVVVDIVAPVDELPEKLISLARQSPSTTIKVETEKDSSALEKIIILLRTQTGHDFSQYKKTTLYRRIERRMGVHQLRKIGSYVRYLQENPTEINILFKELLIGVTNFFRDPAVWEQLKDSVLPAFFAKLPHSYKIRAWIPGCSTGEEAYSLAIIFMEALEKANMNNLSLQIFATDLDSNAIDKARKGMYMANIISDVSPERLNRFFSKVDDQYRINTQIREMIVFAPHNVIKDSPFTKLDILSCRNLLIYLDSDLQKRLLTMFHYSLKAGGILLLGSSETHGSQNSMFSSINSKLRLYQRSGVSKREESVNFPSSFSRNKQDKSENPAQVKNLNNIQTLTDQLLLQQFSPSSVLVTEKGDILYLTGNIGKYLTLAAGKVNMNLFAMARDGLRNDLPLAFRQALQSYDKVVLRNIKIVNHVGTQLIDVTILHIEKPQALENKVLVIFTDVPQQKMKGSTLKKGRPLDATLEAEFNLEIQRLKEELESTYEEMQTSQEELKSTNEELQSTNEELQSANEELTTSKEEMQSLNEELQTINVELQSKIDDSVRVNNDMTNLLNSIEIATLFLDKNLNIRQYTSPATKIFKLKQSDIGRLFTDQVTDLDYPELYNDAKEVLRTLVFIEKPVSTRDGRWFSVRIMPYRTLEDRIDGLVITFINITRSKQLELNLRDSQLMFNSFIGNPPLGVLSMTRDGTIMESNLQTEKILGYKSDDLRGKNYYKTCIDKTLRDKVEKDISKLWSGELPNQYENYIKDINGNELMVKWSVLNILDRDSTMLGLIYVRDNEPNHEKRT